MNRQIRAWIGLMCVVTYFAGCSASKPKHTLEDGAYYLITSAENSVYPDNPNVSVRTVTVLRKVKDEEMEITGFGPQTAVGKLEGDKFTMRTRDGGSFYVFEGSFLKDNHITGRYTRGALSEVGDVGKNNSFELTQDRSRIPGKAERY